MPVPALSRDKKLSILAGVVLAIGYADLWRGGTSASAILLALGYCVLVPLALWPSVDASQPDGAPPRPRRTVQPEIPYMGAAIAFAAVFLLYCVTLDRSTAMWDTSEYITAAATFGLPHPPGNPLFVIVGHALAVLPVRISVAARINSMGAICGAIAAGTWFLLAFRVVRRGEGGGQDEGHVMTAYVAGACAALLAATAFTVWHQSLATEHVYTIALAGLAVVSWLMVSWADDPDGVAADRTLILVAYLLGLGYSNHMAGMLPAPAIALAVLVRRPHTLLRWRLLLACAAVMAVGLTPFATQPIRAAHFPALNEGEPTACRTEIGVACTFSSGTKEAFLYNFNRGQYGKPVLSDRQACPPGVSYPCTLIDSAGPQVGMWWLYFKWQWLRDAHNEHPGVQSALAAVFLVLGLFGGWTHYQKDRQSFWYFGALVFTTTLLLIYYLNFKYGASQHPELQVQREVRDRDYFYLWSFSAWGVWAALGLLSVWESVAQIVGGHGDGEARWRTWAVSSPVLALALVPLIGNWHFASRAGRRDTRDFAADLLNSVEPYGVVVTVGDNDTFPLWYAQEVEGIRKDVVVACTSLLNTDWYVRQIIRRPIYTYDAAKGPTIYRQHPWVKPTSGPLGLTLSEADSVAAYYELKAPMLFNAGDIHALIDPRKLEYGVLQRADALVLRMIQDSWPRRPIYFAVSSGNYPDQLGLGQNMLRQGLAEKLFVPPPKASSDTAQIVGGGWLDVSRSKALADSVFVGARTVIAEGDWVDRPSVGIPYLYVVTDAELADVLHARGNDSAAARLVWDAKQVASAVRLDNLFQSGNPLSKSSAPGGDSVPGIELKPSASDRPGRGR